MSKIQIETITGVHIGSGVSYHRGSDFVTGKVDGEDIIAIVDPRKVMSLIGEKNIDAWVVAIECGRTTDDIVKQYAPKAQITDYALREITQWSSICTDTLKEFIHDGRGKPYIPGSSIKGAIRTAVLAIESENMNGKEHLIKNDKGEISAKKIEGRLFGKNPNKDVFRFLQVGDAVFGKEYEAAVRLINLNEREVKSYWDKGNHQTVEILVPDDKAIFEMKLDMEHYRISSRYTGRMPDSMKSMNDLFKAVNRHTIQLLNSEIEHWKALVNEPNAERVDDYIERLNDVRTRAKDCGDNGRSCVLRIGQGSGWRFITGAWTESLTNFNNEVIPKARPKNERYTQYDFPKSRRIDDQCELLGFVKLTIL